MKYIDADVLREKITEQMESLPREVGRGAGTITSKGYGMMEAFQIMRSIIDSLQQEQPVAEVLEEAAVQAHIQLEESGNLSFLETFKAGAKWDKEQMMKEVVEGIRGENIMQKLDEYLNDHSFYGDKVKLIILLSDE